MVADYNVKQGQDTGLYYVKISNNTLIAYTKAELLKSAAKAQKLWEEEKSAIKTQNSFESTRIGIKLVGNLIPGLIYVFLDWGSTMVAASQ